MIYFEGFLAKGPQGAIDEANVRNYGDIVANSGIYTFTFKDGSTAQGRFTFFYKKVEGEWLIIEHHSSLMPE